MLSLNRLFYTPYRTPFHTPYRTPYPLLLPCIRLHITIFKSGKFQLILEFACTWFHPIIFTFENSNLSFCAKESAFRFGMSVFFFIFFFHEAKPAGEIRESPLLTIIFAVDPRKNPHQLILFSIDISKYCVIIHNVT